MKQTCPNQKPGGGESIFLDDISSVMHGCGRAYNDAVGDQGLLGNRGGFFFFIKIMLAPVQSAMYTIVMLMSFRDTMPPR